MDEPLKINIKDVNHNIVCKLCAGYFIDATTITECLHTFCKSCIVKYLQTSKNCPQCGVKIHETQPLIHLKSDRVLQDIVYKVVPSLYESEERRKHEFYKSRGLAKERREEQGSDHSLISINRNPEAHKYRNDELICLCLEKYAFDTSVPVFQKKFVRTSVRARVQHLKALLRKKLDIPPSLNIDLLCNEELLSNNMCLKEINITHWYGMNTPIVIHYRQSPDTIQTASYP